LCAKKGLEKGLFFWFKYTAHKGKFMNQESIQPLVIAPRNRSKEINELSAALAKAQGKFPAITKDRTVTVPTKSGAEYSYNYVDLATIIEKTVKIMADEGLSASAVIEFSEISRLHVLSTYLCHSSGQWVKSEYPVPDPIKTDPKSFGSHLTYARRYSLQSLINVFAEEDDDAGAASKAHTKTHAPAKKEELGEFVIPKGKFEGRTLSTFSLDELAVQVDFYTDNGKKTPRGWPKKVVEYYEALKALAEESSPPTVDQIMDVEELNF
jgi:hypothetical protein